jgi:serine/threonine protein kinase
MSKTFGRYEILDKLGEGAMGVVYRARDTALGRIVALKMLSAELGAEEELHQRFQREAEAIGRLSHPCIVTVYDLGEAEGQLYMAMELLDGDDLRALIDKHAEVPLADRVRILGEICLGLGYAHSRDVIHRDIKPANILVTSGGRVKLLDFGLARVSTRATITKRGVILGTPDYMSPEQAMGKPIDHRSDIFSAGSVFYEFITYQKPFKGKTLHAVLYQIISEAPEPVLTCSPDVPARLAAVIHRMLEKEAADRYQSMEDVGKDIAAIHAALRRSGSQSAAPFPVASQGTADEIRAAVRDHVVRARAHLDAGRLSKASAEAHDALALDPECEEATEVLWRAGRKLQGESPRGEADSALDRGRVEALLLQAAPDRPAAEARRALAELALIAPDEPRVAELVRARSESRK